MEPIRTIFFGSTVDSVVVLEKLFASRFSLFAIKIVAIVTQPPTPLGRKQILTPTPVEEWAKKNNISVLSFPTNSEKPWMYEKEEEVIDTLQPLKANLLISACYGQKIPWKSIAGATFGGLNVHPSILPRWRGADPVPWAMLAGDNQSGVTIVTLEEKFDEGKIIAQKKVPITPTDLPDPLRTKLFTIGADLLVDHLGDYLSGKEKGSAQDPERYTYARRFTRQDGYVPWKIIEKAIRGEDVPSQELPQLFQSISIQNLACSIDHAIRALSPWPGVWTHIRLKNKDEKRLKLLKAHINEQTLVLDTVQLEGKSPVSYEQFASAYSFLHS